MENKEVHLICVSTKNGKEWNLDDASDFTNLNTKLFRYIHSKHKDILNEYLKNPEIKIEHKLFDGNWGLFEDFLFNYNINLEYRIANNESNLS